ncbi:iron-containing alcohol dehydrogenase [Histomonas meleagridis]|uniref:iron-containing alcohol dehydrogenase n=1 Tax=Histomonas meleagridis TaxID=135588 RepID=UPI0035593A16|nr:iron-containing alcohol dehydrogenase [Histomonas meleagridis]KAH0805935.1 iron-containing alcohol dehydrogenase [Histomonas meleagridis]
MKLLSSIFEFFYKIYCRIFQFIMFTFAHILNWDPPQTIEGPNSILEIPKLLKKMDLKKPLVVTGRSLKRLGVCNDLFEKLQEEGFDYAYFSEAQPNPYIENIEEAKEMYLKEKCDSFIAVGGGSTMDCTKLAACRIARPRTPLRWLVGVIRVIVKLPPVIAVPTTAGTGSEATIAGIVVDHSSKKKGLVIDPRLRPPYAILDPCLTLTLPKHVTAETGMDALTHAVEAYIGRGNMGKTREYSEDAIKLIFENLGKCYDNGNDIELRMNMLKASFKAGLAFTQAYVGYVHAIAHALGGMYNTGHGLANAVILPNVLEYYGDSVYESLAKLSDIIGIKCNRNDAEEKAKAFIEEIRKLNKKMEIPEKFDFIKPEDVKHIVDRALAEGNPLYPVPKIMNRKDCESIVKKIMC